MKIVQGSSKGRGGTGRFRGRGLGDRRFTSRFTDPRFQLSAQLHSQRRQQQSAQEQLAQSIKSDTRFAKRIEDTAAAAVVGISKSHKKASASRLNRLGSDDGDTINRVDVQRRGGTAKATARTRTEMQNKRHEHKRHDSDSSESDRHDDEDSWAEDAHNDFAERGSDDDDDNSYVVEYEKLSSGSDNDDKEDIEDSDLDRQTSTQQPAGHENKEEDETVSWDKAVVDMSEPQTRLAVVNCDWDHIRAVDLYAVLHYALPLGGELHEVCVYISDLGKRMLEHERIHGPDLWTTGTHGAETEEHAHAEDDDSDLSMDKTSSPTHGSTIKCAKNNASKQEITNTKKKKTALMNETVLPDVQPLGNDDFSDVESGFSGSEVGSDGWVDDDPSMLQPAPPQHRGQDEQNNQEGEYFSAGKYRAYEMRRMQYYYAIARFDSADTAAAVYAALDGMDIEASGVVLDLRYVDDSETFYNVDVVSRATSIPPQFRPLRAFRAAALTQSRFRISWDQDSAFRHYTVQDSFTGTSAEDDLAAYLAPPPSDDDENEEVDGKEGNELSKRKRHKGRGTAAEEKMRIRRKYAALLAEIGGLPDVNEEEEESASSNSNAEITDAEGGSVSSGDDDTLNRFSDVDLTSSENSDNDDDDHDTNANLEGAEEGHELREMEATLDLDADGKAVELQREARLRRRAREGNLAAKAELKYKLRRQALKKSKKEMLVKERADDQNKRSIRNKADAARLRALLQQGEPRDTHNSPTPSKLETLQRSASTLVTTHNNNIGTAQPDNDRLLREGNTNSTLTSNDTTTDMGGRERRKAHARKAKEQMAVQREAKRQMRRITHQLGHIATILQPQLESQVQHEAERAMHALDDRFQNKLISDPRFQLDVAQKDRRVDKEIVQLAQTVAKARRARHTEKRKISSADNSHHAAHTATHKNTNNSDEDMKTSVDYFLNNKISSAEPK